jgi:hypothetical protein
MNVSAYGQEFPFRCGSVDEKTSGPKPPGRLDGSESRPHIVVADG